MYIYICIYIYIFIDKIAIIRKHGNNSFGILIAMNIYILTYRNMHAFLEVAQSTACLGNDVSCGGSSLQPAKCRLTLRCVAAPGASLLGP